MACLKFSLSAVAVGITWPRFHSYLPVTTAMGHPDRAGDRSSCLAPRANTLTCPCLAAFMGQLFNHDPLVLDCSSAGLLHSLGPAVMAMPSTVKARQLPLLPPEPQRNHVHCCFPWRGSGEALLLLPPAQSNRATTAVRNKPCLFLLNQGCCCKIRRFR